MTHRITEVLHEYGLSIDDVDAEANVILHEYEKELFHQPTPDTRVQLKKTDIVGMGSEWYNTIRWRGRNRLLPKPFLFRLDAIEPNQKAFSTDRILCLYDNAGESFEPGGETEENPVTRHMSRADGLIFVFDPTKETSFRRACQAHSSDPQWSDQRMSRQSAIFSEAISRILRHRGLRPTDKIDTPLIVLLPKFDAWNFLLADHPLPNFSTTAAPTPAANSSPHKRFDARAVLEASHRVRKILEAHATPLLTRIESVFNPQKVLFVPVSATGCSPQFDAPQPATHKDAAAASPGNNADHRMTNKAMADEPKPDLAENYFRAGDISPFWAEVPALIILRMIAPHLLPTVSK